MKRDNQPGMKNSMSTKRPQCIVVLGMHRSGTSALTGVLQLLGVDLGKDLMQPLENNNPKGFFENNKICHINEAILESLDSSWDSLFPLPENWWQQEHLLSYKQKICEILKSEFSGNNLFGIKDPRMCLLLPFWQQIFRELDITASYVIIVRNPLEIAASLTQRDCFSFEKSGILWMNYMLYAESYSRNYPRVFVFFDNLLDNPQKTIDFIASGLSLSFPHNVQDIKKTLNEFLTPDLKHYNFEDKTVNAQLLSFISKYYLILRNFVNRDDISRKELSKINGLRKDFYRMSKWFYNADIRHIVSELKEKDILLSKQGQEIQQQAQVIQTQKQQLQYQTQKIRCQADALQAQDHIIQQREEFLQAIKNTLSWRITKPLRTIWNMCRLDRFFSKPERTSNKTESSANVNKTELDEPIDTERGNTTLIFKTDYEKWVYRNRLTRKMETFFRSDLKEFKYTPKFSIVLPVYNTPEDLLMKALESINVQIYENWEACIVNDGSTEDHVDNILCTYAQNDPRYRYKRLDTNQGIVSASNEALQMTTGDYIVLMDHDDTLEKDALLQIVKYLQDNNDVDIIYTDNDKIDVNDNSLSSQFKPDWSPELMYSYCYVVHLKIFSKRIVQEIGLFREGFDGAQDYDYFLRAAEKARRIAHIPLTLYHWREVPGQQSTADKSIENGRKAVEQSLRRQQIDWVDVVQADFAEKSQNGIYKLLPTVTFYETVSIIINVRNHCNLVKACIDSIDRKTTYRNFEIIITDDESDDVQTIEYLKHLSAKYKVLWLRREEKQGFNFSKLNNEAVKSASGDYLVFLNADTGIISSDWLEEMLLYCKMSGVGVVGAKLVLPNGKIQHAGVIKGFFNGLACHAFKNIPKTERGYMDFAGVARNYSAVTAACLMMRKDLFMEIGGFDEINLPIAYNDVDLCLRIGQRGYRIIYNPYAELLHHEGKFRGERLSGSKNVREEAYFRGKWKTYIEPYYNINQSLQYEATFKEAVNQNTRLSLFNLSRKNIKILSVSHNLNLEGASHIKLSVDRYLNSKNNVDLHVICLTEGPLYETYKQLDIPIDILNLNWNTDLDGFKAFTDQIREYIKKGEFDLIYANTLDTFWAIEAAHSEHVPSIWNIHESVDYDNHFDGYSINTEIRKIAKQAFVKSNRNLFVCNTTAKMFKKYDYYGVSEVIYNGINLDKSEPLKKVEKNILKQKLDIPLDKKNVSIIGTTCPRKGQLDFAKAAVEILRERNDVCFLIVGAREMDYLHEIRDVIKDEKNIYLINETPEAVKYFRISDIFVCASYNESFPVVILEAMSFSLPIVTTPVFGISEQIVDGKTGLFFEPGDIHTMKMNIEKLLDDTHLAQELGDNAYLTVKSNFSEQEMVEKYYQLMEVVAFEDVNIDGSSSELVPNPPSQFLKQISGDPRAESFISSFSHVRNNVKHYLSLAGFEFSQFKKILDFGCGLGRFLFAFQSELRPDQNLWGCDVSKERVQWCQDNIGFATVDHNDIQPPLPYENDQFNFVYSLSVFTHLKLELQFRWAWEIYRVLRPGGVLFMSVHGPYFFPIFFDVCRSENMHSATMYSLGGEGLFAYLDTTSREEDQGQVEVAAAHSHSFVKELFSMFQFVKRFPQSIMAGGQDVYILRKPHWATEIAQPVIRNSSITSICTFEENITPESSNKGVKISFNIQGQRVFRVYPQIEPAGSYPIGCDIDIRSSDGKTILAQQQIPFNNNQVFGKTHYAVIEIKIPEYSGIVTVLLKTIIDKNALPREREVHTVWCFPNFAHCKNNRC